jgi:hypothetical protein
VNLFDFLSSKNNVNIPSKSNKQKNCVKKLVLCWHGYADPDPDAHQNVMDPEQSFEVELGGALPEGVQIRGSLVQLL